MRQPPTFAVVALLVLGAGSARVEAAAPAAPNILLITVDTLRADHLGAYGYALPTSPRIDALARAGARCDAVMSSASETAPATASLLTGLYQPMHRVTTNRAVLPPDVTTLAERLRAAGYTTAGFVGNGLVAATYGFDQGFDVFEEFHTDATMRSDANGVDAAAAWLRGEPRSPWFLWLHLMDPHGPYAPAPAWEGRVSYPPARDAAVRVGLSNFGLGIIPRYQVIPGAHGLSAYVRRYDGEIHFTDTQIGRLLDVVSALGLRKETVVIVTADHGESLTEHDEYLQHGWFLYETTMHIPLIVAWLGTLPAGRTVARSLSAVDLTPTVLDLAGRPVPVLDGTSILGDLTGASPGRDDHVALAVGARENHPFAVREGRWKLVHTRGQVPPVPASRQTLGRYDAAERYELYDLATDPGETKSRADQPERRAALAERARSFRKALRMSGHAW